MSIDIRRNYESQDSEPCCIDPYRGVDLSWLPEEVRKAGHYCQSPLSDIRFDIERGSSLLELGCGPGMDGFILSRLVGPEGRVVGVDTIADKLSIARKHVDQMSETFGYTKPNVEFAEAPLEELPLESNSIDLVLSNCAINLSEDVSLVYDEIFRVLKPAGRFVITDLYSQVELPNYVKQNKMLAEDGLNVAEPIDNLLEVTRNSGFRGISLIISRRYALIDIYQFFALTVTAYKPHIPLNGKEKYATLIGPCSHTIDELSNTYERGKELKVSAETAAILELPTYRDFFFVSDESRKIKSPMSLSIPSESGPCLYMGDFVTLFGPFTQLQDDDSHVFNAGQELEICNKTLKVLSSPLYKKLFIMINRSLGRVDPDDSCCGPSGTCGPDYA